MRIGNYDIGFFYARKVEGGETRSLSLSNPALASYFGLPTSAPNITVSQETVLGIPPAFSAIRYISEGIASLNRGVFRRDRDGDVFEDHDSPVAYLFDGRPHPYYTTFDFLQALVSNACMGNGYARIHRDAVTMRPTALELIPQEFVTIDYAPNGALYYHVCGTIDQRVVNVYLPETEMIHIKGVTFTGIKGKPMTIVHRDSFSKGIGAQKYSKNWFEKGATVGGIITFPLPLSPEQREDVRNKITTAHAGAANAGSIMVLDDGADFKAITVGPKDAHVIDFSNLTTVEVSQIFKMPLHLLSQLDRSTFSNMEQQNQDFVIHCLQPWARKIQEEFTTKLFSTSEVRTRRRFFAFDLEPLQMGDMAAQATFFSSAIQNGWMTPNEVRRKKNMNKIEGGDQLFIQQNMAPMDMLTEILEGKQNGQIQTPQAQDAQSDDDQNDTNNSSDEQPSAAA